MAVWEFPTTWHGEVDDQERTHPTSFLVEVRWIDFWICWGWNVAEFAPGGLDDGGIVVFLNGGDGATLEILWQTRLVVARNVCSWMEIEGVNHA